MVIDINIVLPHQPGTKLECIQLLCIKFAIIRLMLLWPSTYLGLQYISDCLLDDPLVIMGQNSQFATVTA